MNESIAAEMTAAVACMEVVSWCKMFSLHHLQASVPALAAELGPYLPAVATELLPTVTYRLFSRIAARAMRELYIE